MCFFIFFTKAGQYTREEFAAAREQFEKTDKPKIYTYFKVLGEEKGEDNLYAFMDELDKTLGHYYGTFEHIDTVKLRILLNLKLQELDFIEIRLRMVSAQLTVRRLFRFPMFRNLQTTSCCVSLMTSLKASRADILH